MRPLVAILFILGIGWALLAWVVVTLPVFIFIPRYRYDWDDSVFSLLGASLALVGYWIWIGWAFYLVHGRYPLTSPVQFWSISLIHHGLWAFLIPFGLVASFGGSGVASYPQEFRAFWQDGQDLPFRIWIVLNICVAIFMIWFNLDSDKKTKLDREVKC